LAGAQKGEQKSFVCVFPIERFRSGCQPKEGQEFPNFNKLKDSLAMLAPQSIDMQSGYITNYLEF